MNAYFIKPLVSLACLFLPLAAFSQTSFITTQPESRSVHLQSMVIFGVGTQPEEYSFQWLLDGEEIEDANDQTLTIEANPNTAGVYTVAVSDGQNSEVSDPATLALLDSFSVALDQELEPWSTRFSITGEEIQKNPIARELLAQPE